MFSKVFSITAIAALAVSNVAAIPTMVARHHQLAERASVNPACPNITKQFTPSPGWPTAQLEDYTCYHTRYLALDCQDKHGDQSFFNTCCTPLAKGQSISTRPAKCNPFQTTSSTKSTAKPTSTKVTSTSTKKASTSPAQPTGGFITGGIATFYEQGGAAGACGHKHSDNDLIVAVDTRRYGNPDKVSPLCGKTVEITNLKNGKVARALVADACPTCENSNSLDMSHGLFLKALGGTVDEGIFPIKYRYV